MNILVVPLLPVDQAAEAMAVHRQTLWPEPLTQGAAAAVARFLSQAARQIKPELMEGRA